MVGVPRSKGCRICVQRRVKCDLAKPTCNNCNKGNRPCPGYDQDLKFQDEGKKLRKRFENKTSRSEAVARNDSPTVAHITSTPSQGQAEVGNQHTDTITFPVVHNSPLSGTPASFRSAIFSLFESKRHIDPGGSVLSNEQGDANPNIVANNEEHDLGEIVLQSAQSSESLQPPGFGQVIFSPFVAQEQLLSTFMSSILHVNSVSLARGMRFYGLWLSHLPPLTGQNKLLDAAVRATSLAQLGRCHGSDSMLNESKSYYGKSLRLLNIALSNSENGMKPETLSATILLSFYEMFASDSNESWVRHAGGAVALMKVRGAKRHRYGFDRDIFMAYRHIIVIDSYQKDEKCFLNQPEWREVSQHIQNDIRNSGLSPGFLECFNHSEAFYVKMLELSEVFHHANHLRESFRNQSTFHTIREFVLDLVLEARRHRGELKGIFVRFFDSLKVINCVPSSYVSHDPTIPIYYSYSNIFIGSFCTGYWTILIILNTILIELEKSLTPENVALYRAENHESGLEICRSTEWMMTSSFLGPFSSTFGLRMCLKALEQSEERDWVVRKLFEIANTHMRMAAHIPGFDPGTGIAKVRAVVSHGPHGARFREIS